jgi:hypothetical protein
MKIFFLLEIEKRRVLEFQKAMMLSFINVFYIYYILLFTLFFYFHIYVKYGEKQKKKEKNLNGGESTDGDMGAQAERKGEIWRIDSPK